MITRIGGANVSVKVSDSCSVSRTIPGAE